MCTFEWPFSKTLLKGLGALFLFFVACLPVSAQIVNPFKGTEPPEWTRAKGLSAQIDALPDTNVRKGTAKGLFAGVRIRYELMVGGSHPATLRVASHLEQIRAQHAEGERYDADLKNYKDDGEKYRADNEAYKAAGGGGTYDQNDPKLAMLQAWHGRLVAWYQRREEWRLRLDSWVNAFNARNGVLRGQEASLNAELQNEYAQWKAGVEAFSREAEKVLRTAEIEKKIADMKVQLDRDKRALEYYKDKLPGLHADVEAMAKEADEAREAGRMAAIDKAIGLALDGAISSVEARQAASQAQLKQVKDILIKNGVRPADAKKVLKGWFDAPKSVPSIKRTKEMLEQLGLLRDMAAAYDATTKQQYYEALATCLGVFVKTPLLKLAVTNFELYSNLLYTGLSYASAKARVTQYGKLADGDLRAIAKLSTVYQKHLKEMVELKKQLADMQ